MGEKIKFTWLFNLTTSLSLCILSGKWRAVVNHCYLPNQHLLVSWLPACLIDWLVDWLAGWLATYLHI